MPYGITQCYLLPDTSDHTPPSPQPHRPVLDLPTPEGWKAELTYVTCYIPRWFTRPQTVTHPCTNRAQCRLTSLIKPTPLTTTLRRHPIIKKVWAALQLRQRYRSLPVCSTALSATSVKALIKLCCLAPHLILNQAATKKLGLSIKLVK